jgi:arabinose-5-phosphate isomerase
MLLRARGVWDEVVERYVSERSGEPAAECAHDHAAETTTRQATLLERGRRVVRLEREALAEVESRLDERFARAVELIAASTGRVIVAGVGKSGLIGRKIAATFTSTGTPATFLHPVDSVHGDLGIVGGDDVAILISKSGETDELVGLLQHLKRFGVRTIALTGVVESTLDVIPTWHWTSECVRRRVHTISHQRRVPRRRSRSATRLQSRCWRRRGFDARTSRAFTPAAHSVANCSRASMT